jgi:hypothetical protein
MPQDPEKKKKPKKAGPRHPNQDIMDLMAGLDQIGPAPAGATQGPDYFNPRGRGPQYDDRLTTRVQAINEGPPKNPVVEDARRVRYNEFLAKHSPGQDFAALDKLIGDAAGSVFGGSSQPKHQYVKPPQEPEGDPAVIAKQLAEADASTVQGAEMGAYKGAQENFDYDQALEGMFREKAEEAGQEEASAMTKARQGPPAAMGGVREPVTPDRYKPSESNAMGRIAEPDATPMELPPEFQGEPSGPEPQREQPGALEVELEKLRNEASKQKDPNLFDTLAVLGTGLSGVGAERTMGVADKLQGGPERRTAKDRALRLAEYLQRQKSQDQALQGRLGSQERIAAANIGSRVGMNRESIASREGISGANRQSREGMFDVGQENKLYMQSVGEQGKGTRLERGIEGRADLQRDKPEKGLSYRDMLALQNSAMKPIDAQIGALDRAVSDLNGNTMVLPQDRAKRLASLAVDRQRLEKLRTQARAAIATQIGQGSVPTSAFDIPEVAQQYDAIYSEMMKELENSAKPGP